MTAPTTAEVRERLATAGLVVARASGDEREREAVTMAVGGGCLALKTYALPIAEHRDALAQRVAELEAERLRALKIGYQRTQDCQSLPEMAQALVDAIGHVSAAEGRQLARACAAEAEVARLREALEIACNWWGGCGHHADDCPVDADECKAAKRVNELAAKGAGR